MIAEENLSNNFNTQVGLPKTDVLLLINKLLKQTVPNFQSYLISDFHKKNGSLNEDQFTQIFIEQAQILIRNNDYPFNINGQYSDIYNLSKGFSDFYFYTNEQNVSTVSFFSIESKRLPSPEKSREKEYVIGDKNNGGIERYKTEKHGKGLDDCGLLGFVEKENSSHWKVTINNWIRDLAKNDKNWCITEILTEVESDGDFCFLKSIAHRKSGDINLTHLWVTVN